MGLAAERVGAQFVVSVGDNFYEEGIPDDRAKEFGLSLSEVYTHRSLAVPWYAGEYVSRAHTVDEFALRGE